MEICQYCEHATYGDRPCFIRRIPPSLIVMFFGIILGVCNHFITPFQDKLADFYHVCKLNWRIFWNKNFISLLSVFPFPSFFIFHTLHLFFESFPSFPSSPFFLAFPSFPSLTLSFLPALYPAISIIIGPCNCANLPNISFHIRLVRMITILTRTLACCSISFIHS